MEKLMQELTEVMIQKKQIEQREQQIKGDLLLEMKKQKIESLENSKIKISFVSGSTRNYIDRDKLKKLFPDVVKQCTKVVPLDDFLRVKINA